MLIKLLSRALGGFAFGVFVGQVVQIIISLSLGEGKFMPVIPDFRSLFESEITAVIVQMMLTGFIGVAYATSSVVFDIAKWSLLKQYVVHFCITAIVWVPIVTICWMPKTYMSFLILGVNFLGTYLITWFIQYTISKKDIQEINSFIKAEQ
ncbi:MAG: DUF3021 domain-containing protein [Bacillota bacterium]